MAEPSDKIPDHLSNAFHEVVWRYATWDPSAPEITVRIINDSYPMSAVCGFMDKFNDPLPEGVLKQLDGYMDDQYRELKEKLDSKHTPQRGWLLLAPADRREQGWPREANVDVAAGKVPVKVLRKPSI